MDVCKMRSVSCFVVVVLTLIVSMQQGVMGFKEFKVGGVEAWHVPEAKDTDFYNNWASTKRFHVGDTLRFEYKNDTLLVVEKYAYFHCDQTKASTTYNDGNTTIKLEHPGLTYFISGSVEHCRNGQRIEVDVMSPHSHAVAFPPEGHYHQAEFPAPNGAPAAKSSGSLVVQASPLGLVVVLAFIFLV